MSDGEYDEKLAPHKSENVRTDVFDSESHVDASIPPEARLKRQLKNRHIAMISIGGVIGTGLFLGTAKSLSQGGPIGLLLGYVVVGTICYSVMVGLSVVSPMCSAQ
ncbi:uncharacterized protein B0H18DRAFT_971503 [Fomitopsis serialis]|uniref:uncharacterized protein n=1 Tax=Fomitopsis serialis TaxID=139415 RepID=UPI00200797DA|nr:uncharacterized protein B0H18DRAFT_971503 [Neoantrodia serialis]KAH9937630.1 hypothetical protein B0H18DRAFT_971503 [Neoantrodia serialis]